VEIHIETGSYCVELNDKPAHKRHRQTINAQ
jgi:hypothetical protein